MKYKYLMLMAVAGFAFVSCSDDMPNGSNTQSPQTDGINVNVITDQSVLGARVHNYKGGALSRAALPDVFDGLTEMPDYDAVEAAAAAAAQATSADNNTVNALVNAWGGGDVCITADVDDLQLGCSGKNIYVKGNVKITNTWGSDYNLYILKRASVTWAGGNKINDGNISASQANVKYYNYGTLDAGTGKVIGIYGGTELYNAAGAELVCDEIVVNGGRTDWSTGSEVVYPSKLFVEGSLDYVNLKPQKGCVVNVTDALIAPDIDLEFDGDVRVETVKARSLKVTNTCHFYSTCGVILDEDFTINANGSKAELTYVKAANVYQCAGSAIRLPNEGMMDIEGIYRNLNNGNDAKVELTGEGFAVIKAKELHWNAGDPLTNVYLFKTPYAGGQIVTDCEKYARLDNDLKPVYMNFDDFEFLGATVKRIESDADRTMSIAPGTGCNVNGYNPKPVPDPNDPVIDIVTDIDHNHDISATCIQWYNDKVYATYHQRGAAQHGCIEVFETVNDQTKLLQYVEDENAELDFNHLIIDGAVGANGRLYAVGNSSKKGGIMAYIDLAADGLMDTEIKNTESSTGAPLNLIKLQAGARGDGNCIIRNGDHYNVMTTSGFETYNAADLSLKGFIPTPGKAKHIAVGGDNIYATYLTRTATTEEEEIPVEMRRFSTSSVDLSDQIGADIAAGTIQPNNGKNVVAVDPSNGNVYVCLGRDGLRCMDASGATLWTYQPEHITIENPESDKFGAYKAFCNGVAVDNNYIYVAYGTFGLIILDKNGNKVAQSKSVKSANYVALADGYIYVAYGRERIRVYKFYPEGIKGYETKY